MCEYFPKRMGHSWLWVMCGVCGKLGSEETESFGKRPDHQCCGGRPRCCRGRAMHTCERKRVFCEGGNDGELMPGGMKQLVINYPFSLLSLHVK